MVAQIAPTTATNKIALIARMTNRTLSEPRTAAFQAALWTYSLLGGGVVVGIAGFCVVA